MAKATKKKPAKRLPKKLKTQRQDRRSRTRRRGQAAVNGAEMQPEEHEPGAGVLDRLFAVVTTRRTADPAFSHSARLLSRGIAKVAQKFGEEAVECLIEAVAGQRKAVIAESADVLYHLIVLWVASGVDPDEVWAELKRREGVSGIAEKAARARGGGTARLQTTKIP